VAWAVARAACSAVGSSVASFCPADTCCPTVTSIDVTAALVGKVAVTWSTRWTDPGKEIVCVTFPVPTVEVR